MATRDSPPCSIGWDCRRSASDRAAGSQSVTGAGRRGDGGRDDIGPPGAVLAGRPARGAAPELEVGVIQQPAAELGRCRRPEVLHQERRAEIGGRQPLPGWNTGVQVGELGTEPRLARPRLSADAAAPRSGSGRMWPAHGLARHETRSRLHRAAGCRGGAAPASGGAASGGERRSRRPASRYSQGAPDTGARARDGASPPESALSWRFLWCRPPRRYAHPLPPARIPFRTA